MMVPSGDSWEGWSDPYSGEFEILGMKMGTADQLREDTDKQIELAEKGRGLRAYNAMQHTSRWYQAPTNNLGAYYRAAYWLAVGARVLIARGKRTAARTLLAQAKQNRSFLTAKQLFALPFAADKGKETEILQRAGRLALSKGLTSIAKVLQVLPSRIGFAREQREARGVEKAVPSAIAATAQLKHLETGKRPWWLWPLVGGLAIVAVGVVFRPYFQAGREMKKER